MKLQLGPRLLQRSFLFAVLRLGLITAQRTESLTLWATPVTVHRVWLVKHTWTRGTYSCVYSRWHNGTQHSQWQK